MNIITVVATDAATNQSTVVRHVSVHTILPVLIVTAPIDSVITNITQITVRGTVSGQFSITLTVNGAPVSVGLDSTFSTQVNLQEGINTITIVVTDAAGNKTTITRTVRRDTQAPIVSLTSPIDSLLTNQLNVTVSGTVKDSTAVTLTINGNSVPIGANGAFSYQLSAVEGFNTITVVATDAAGNSTNVKRTVILDTTPPVLTITSPADGSTISDSAVVVSGKTTDQTKVMLSVNGQTISLGNDGSFATAVSLNIGSNTITISATDVLGQTTTILRTVIREGEQLPPDPATVAPALDLTVPTTMATATSFLYTGTNPIQKGVEPGTIDPIRVAVIRGKVLKRDVTPLSGVKITILNHPEYGSTLSRADGMFDLAVNGGGLLTIDYKKDGYLPLQRQIDARWQNYVVVDSVVMIQLDANVTTINFSDSIEVARGSVVTDQSGTRRATLFFRKGTVAKMIKKNYATQTIQDGCNTRTVKVLTDSTVQDLPTMSVRATEYTVGATGLQAMPSVLPPASAYTYCVELSADEAIAMKADAVVFNKPVSIYQENFLGFPTGTIVPVGYYDNSAGNWIPQNNGRVIQILGAINGVAQIDLDGDNIAEADSVLEANQFDLTEREQLALLYPSGQSLWRTLLSHFSPIDMNFPQEPDGPAPSPEDIMPPFDFPEDNGPGLNDPLPGDDGGGSGGGGDNGVGDNGSSDNGSGLSITSYSGDNGGSDDGGGNGSCDCENTCPQPTITGSIISPQHQTLGEIMNLNGTPYKLIYQSDRGRGNKASYELNVRVSGDSLPEKIKRMDVVLEVAGRKFTQSYLPAPNVVSQFMWDGKDVYGQMMQGEQHYQVKVGYVYSNSFYVVPGRLAAEFGLPPSTDSVLVPSINDYTAWSTYGGNIGTLDVLSYGFGGWTINVQHSYDFNTKTLFFGNGKRKNIQVKGSIIDSVSGTSGSGETWMAVSPEGVLYFSHSYDQKVFRRCTDGTVSIVAGTGVAGYSGDGGLAIQATLSAPSGLALDKNGNLYIADADNNCI
jgi:hypothetical protein